MSEVIINVKDNTDKININVKEPQTKTSVDTPKISTSTSTDIAGDKYYVDLAKDWAIKTDGKVLGEDYSSKYYATQTKGYYDEIKETVETIIEDAVETVEEKAAEAQESADDAQESADIAQMYAQQSTTGMIWIEVNSEEWVQEGNKYKREINNLLAVAGVFSGIWQNKQKIEYNATITNEKTIIYCPQPVTGYILATTAVIEPEEELEASVLNVYGEGNIEATREGRNVTLKTVNFVFEQGVASDRWVIVHNLGKKPSIILTDSAGTEFRAHIEYDSLNQCTIYINGATTGKAYLN